MQHSTSIRAMAASATLHCLTGCAIGEITGMLIGTALGLGTIWTIVLAVALAFLFGYALSTLPLLRAGLSVGKALSIVLVADTLSIAVMEIVDNAVMAAIPGALHAGLTNPVFWIAMAIALTVAFVAAYPVNLWLLRRGRGHALTMAYHEGHGGHEGHGAAGHDMPEDHGMHAGHEMHEGHDAAAGRGTAGDDTAAAAPALTPRPWIPNLSTGALAGAIGAFLAGGLLVAIVAQTPMH